eukprot:12024638-Karenia_brevis.AAC.1
MWHDILKCRVVESDIHNPMLNIAHWLSKILEIVVRKTCHTTTIDSQAVLASLHVSQFPVPQGHH